MRGLIVVGMGGSSGQGQVTPYNEVISSTTVLALRQHAKDVHSASAAGQSLSSGQLSIHCTDSGLWGLGTNFGMDGG